MREFAPLVGSPESIADQLAELGLPVEEMVSVGAPVEGVVTARILAVRPHPKADRIRLVDVDAGDGSARQICCGAPNLFEGDVVPLATIGTVMPNGMTIAYREMRGEPSNGMLCSAVELGLGADSEGLLLLDRQLPLGQPVFEALGIERDVVYDLDVTPNRPEALSVAGVARDLAALQGVAFAYPESKPFTPVAPSTASLASVEIHDPHLCGRFTIGVLSDVTITSSPWWMQLRLAWAGMRPINNVVDVSNYVMLELGQPSHAFDLDTVPDGALTVRSATEGERLVTLDDKERRLSSADGVITDREGRALAIAGVMGGADTEIGDASTRVLLEMAWWDPLRIEATSARHQLHSEASLRYKRGVDTAIVPRAMDRFIELLAQTCPLQVHEGRVVAEGDLPKPASISVRPTRVSALLGAEFTAAQVEELLEPIGFEVGEERDGAVIVTAPTFRPDCQTEIDIIEELARHRLYSAIRPVVPRPPQTGSLSVNQARTRRLRGAFLSLGLDEAMPLPFLAPGELGRTGLDPTGIPIANPLVADESIMRTSLLPGLLRAVRYNESHRCDRVRLFEFGHVFPPGELSTDVERSVSLGKVLLGEVEMAAACLAGAEAPAAVEVATAVLNAAGILASRILVQSTEIPGLHPTRAARLSVDGEIVGSVGEVHPTVLADWEIDERVAYVELDIERLLALPVAPVQALEVSKYPASDFDLAVVVDEETDAATVLNAVRRGDPLVVRVGLLDVYRSSTLGDGRKSVTVSVRLQSLDHTLTEAEIRDARAALIGAIGTIGGTLRS
jgi:phenylalanyl-tRNA synthetase beta chain